MKISHLDNDSLLMTPTDNKTKLVKIYYYICEMYEKELNSKTSAR